MTPPTQSPTELQQALERLAQQLLHAERLAGIGSWEVERASEQLFVSPNFCALVGLPVQTAIPLSTLFERAHPDDRTPARAAVQRFWHEQKPVEFGYRAVLDDGSLRSMEVRMEGIVGDHPATRARGTLRDVTERDRTESERRFQAHLLAQLDASIIASDLAGRVTHWDVESERLYGFTAEQALGRRVRELIGNACTPPEMRAALKAGGAWHGEITVTRPDGTVSPRYLRVGLFHDAAGQPLGHVGVSVDISRQVAAQESEHRALAHLRAVTDSMGEGMLTIDAQGRLTYMNSAAEEMLGWSEAELHGQAVHNVINHTHADGTPYPLATCPLNLFVSATVAPEDEVLRDAADVFIRKDDSRFPVAYSASRLRTDGVTTGAVMVFRDITEQKAQEARIADRLATMEVLQEIRDALAEDRMELFAQPIIDLATNETIQHELLIRMRNREGRLVPPSDFLPIAETHGLIREIDRWVIGQAAALVGQGHAVEINLSGQSIGDPDTCNVIRDELEAAGGDPTKLVVEVTETALVERMDLAADVISELGALGCKVALDDFGTGHAGFSYLKQLPFDSLKIDIEFVRELPDDEASSHVVRAVVDLARNFGYQTVAEGVETAAARDALRALGVNHAQGYFLGRPAPLSETLLAAKPQQRPPQA